MFNNALSSCITILCKASKPFLFCGILVFGFGCNSGNDRLQQKPVDNKYQLFTEEHTAQHPAARLNKEEAIQRSAVVVLTTSIVTIDSTDGRGGLQYLYQVNQAETMLKSDTATIIKFPLRFIATERLDFSAYKNKPVYIFLDTLSPKSVLRQSANLKYRWLKKAPVLKG
ncbi:hypothetical protein DBR32_14180 [Taibaiella sp. KBW10]|uniref:hypothetical protein n=1 Tax=Taibaiella sp. KBW10 TaxID=2153357 RepID=UPI000F593FB1|nr:hypothetical protein [Taibaiella sp. KBW10]RQO29731.1 hypothetical protein DBR32_14180 [Taibaiella sp. KBW10]